jgi:hypothetical protein
MSCSLRLLNSKCTYLTFTGSHPYETILLLYMLNKNLEILYNIICDPYFHVFLEEFSVTNSKTVDDISSHLTICRAFLIIYSRSEHI